MDSALFKNTQSLRKLTAVILAKALVGLWLFSSSSHAYQESASVRPCGWPTPFTVFEYKGLAYFCAETNGSGGELHVSNGSEFGTQLVIDIDAGPGGSSPFGFFEYKGAMYFVAETNLTGYALWRSDGTEAGTLLVKMLTSEVDRRDLEIAGETSQGIYFRLGSELFLTDGTHAGTNRIDVPIVIGYLSSATEYASSGFFVIGDVLYVLTSAKLYKLDQSGGSFQIAEFESQDTLFPYVFSNINFNGGYLIRENAAGGNSRFANLWFTDGTPSGTKLLRSDVAIPVGVINGKLILANDDALYSSVDGVQLDVIVDEGFRYHGLGNLFTNKDDNQFYLNDALVLAAFDGEGHQPSPSLWVTDGSANGTVRLPLSFPLEVIETNPSSGKRELKTLDGKLVSQGGANFDQLWMTDGTVSGSRVIDANVEEERINLVKTVVGGFFYGKAQQLWQTNSAGEIKKLHSQYPISGDHFSEGQRLFSFTRQTTGDELWHSDGTSAGTYQLKYYFENGRERPKVGILPPLLYLLDDDQQAEME